MALSIQPNSSNFYEKGLALEFLKRNKEALQKFIFYTLTIFSFQEALKLDPSDEDIKNKINEI